MEPRWLDADERQIWLGYLLATRRLWTELERALLARTGLPLTYYEILSVLSEVPDRRLRMTDLAALLQVSPSRVSHAVSRLEQDGLVRRESHPSDRRGWVAILTDAGFDAVRDAAPDHVASVRTHLFDQLSPEQLEHLDDISRTLLAHLAPEFDLAQAFSTRNGENS
jgi:DNA-binding MarR family transcriptional regulator